MTPPVTHHDQERFREAVRDLLGLEFEDARLEDLAAALRERLSATGRDASDYLDRLRARGDPAERRVLARLLTVCETYFLRSGDQFRALVEVAIPDRLRRLPSRRTLHVLSAGCSSGEEPHSIAIALHEAMPGLFETHELLVTGIDVNPERLDQARGGRYGKWSLRDLPEETIARWFRRSGREFVLDDRIRRSVTFEERNLVEEDPTFWRPEAFDVVFFRNVGMYFPPEIMSGVVRRIARSLAPGGFLFLGHAETLRGVSQAFHLRHRHGCFYYQLRDPGDRDDEAPRTTADRQLPAVDADTSWVQAIRRASDRIAALDAALAPAVASAQPPDPAAARWDRAPILELFRQERIGDAMELLERLPAEASADPDALLLRAVLLTSRGEIEQAERVCGELLRVDDLNAGAHYLAALCREHAGDRDAASEHDQAAAYLDPGFAMPRLHLGLLAKRRGDRETARHELAQAEILLQREDVSRILLFGGGFRREGLLQLCRAELRACGGVA